MTIISPQWPEELLFRAMGVPFRERVKYSLLSFVQTAIDCTISSIKFSKSVEYGKAIEFPIISDPYHTEARGCVSLLLKLRQKLK